MRSSNDDLTELVAIVLVLVGGLAILAGLVCLPALILTWVWANVVMTIWTGLPVIGFWQMFFSLWALSILSKFFRRKVTANASADHNSATKW